MSEKDEEHSRSNVFSQFCGTKVIVDKVRDDFHLTGKYRNPAHNNFEIIV